MPGLARKGKGPQRSSRNRDEEGKPIGSSRSEAGGHVFHTHSASVLNVDSKSAFHGGGTED